MASNSGWSKGLPSGTSNIALGDNDIRSNNSVLQVAWEDEHYFMDGSATSAGVHKTGSARAYYQASAPTAVAPVGQLWMDSDNGGTFVASAAGSASWVSVKDPQFLTVDASLVASATLTQGQSLVTQFFNVITQAGNDGAVTLPTPYLGRFCALHFTSQGTYHIFPPSGAAIDAFGSNNSDIHVLVSGSETKTYFGISATKWHVFSVGA